MLFCFFYFQAKVLFFLFFDLFLIFWKIRKSKKTYVLFF
jgi:hypothetical protein